MADLLAAFGVLAGLLCYIQAARPHAAHRARWLAALAVAAAVGIGSKESAIVLPALMLLWDVTLRSNSLVLVGQTSRSAADPLVGLFRGTFAVGQVGPVHRRPT